MTHELVVDTGDVVETTQGTEQEISRAYATEQAAAVRLGWLTVKVDSEPDGTEQTTYWCPNGSEVIITKSPIDA